MTLSTRPVIMAKFHNSGKELKQTSLYETNYPWIQVRQNGFIKNDKSKILFDKIQNDWKLKKQDKLKKRGENKNLN